MVRDTSYELTHDSCTVIIALRHMETMPVSPFVPSAEKKDVVRYSFTVCYKVDDKF